MADRWNRRVTAVIAGAGFGKSGLLVEALAANRAAPLGVDAWIGCQEEDVRADRFFEAVFTAVRGAPPLDLPVDLDDAVHRIADAVWSHAPQAVSIVVDDVHLLSDASAGAALLDALVRRLPATANFVVTSRAGLPFSITRLRSTGDAVVLTETDLAMNPTELQQLAVSRGVPALDLTATGGWPALAELALHTGTAASSELKDYLTEELLDDLPKSHVRALAVLAEVGPLTAPDLMTVVGEHDLDVDALLRLPLVDTAAGVIEAHGLWSAAIEFTDPDWLRMATASAAGVLHASGATERAFDLALAGEDRALAVEILGDLCRRALHATADVDLAACLAGLPVEQRNTPEAVLAAALSDDSGGWTAARDRLIATSIALADAGAADLELVALTRLGSLGWQAADLSVADHLFPRVERLARSGDPDALAVVALGSALLAEMTGDEAGMWAHIESFANLPVAEPLRTMGQRYRASLDLQYGSAEAALRRLVTLEDEAPAGLRVEVRVLAMWAAWLAGDDREALRRAEQLRVHQHGDDGLLARSSVGLFDAWSSVAADHVEMAEAVSHAAAARSSGMLVPSLVSSMAGAAWLVAAGDEHAAATLLEEAFGAPGIVGARARPAAIRGLALVWVLLPHWRDDLRALETGESPAAALRAARTLIAARHAVPGDTAWFGDAAAVLADPALPSLLPALWVAELAARYVGGDPTSARLAAAQDAIDRLGALATPALRRVVAATTDRGVSAGATSILSRRTPVSEGRFTLRLLGPTAMERNGDVVDHPDWRRDRVRRLFALVARQGTVARRTAADALWPDLDPESGANNLRVTLSYLQKVLEPGRTRHEVAYHVRGDGSTLRFTGRSSWTIDVEEFETILGVAERDDQRGESAAALDGYMSAIAWYRGPYLADVDIDAGDEIERERLSSRYVRTLIRAGSLLLAVGRHDEAQRLAIAAQTADPWSEFAVCLQAEAYLASGDRAAALRTTRRAAELVAELGLSPTAELRRLERALGEWEA